MIQHAFEFIQFFTMLMLRSQIVLILVINHSALYSQRRPVLQFLLWFWSGFIFSQVAVFLQVRNPVQWIPYKLILTLKIRVQAIIHQEKVVLKS